MVKRKEEIAVAPGDEGMGADCVAVSTGQEAAWERVLAELEAQREAVAQLQAQVAALQERQTDRHRKQLGREEKGEQGDHQTEAGGGGSRVSRGGLLKAVAAGAAGLAGAALLPEATPAGATQGSAVIAGQSNTATGTTQVDASNGGTNKTNADGLSGIGSQSYSGVSGFGGSAGGAGLIGFAGADANGTGSGVIGVTTAGLNPGQNQNAGVYGASASGDGVFGLGGIYGVHGNSNSVYGTGVFGESTGGGVGVMGESSGGSNFAGVWGNNHGTGAGVVGIAGDGPGGSFQSTFGPQLHLEIKAASGAPTSGTFSLGDLWLDFLGVLFVCTANGSPGTWKSLSSVVPIPSVRVLNTRPTHQIGPYTGPIANNTVLTLTLAGTNGIPSNATGVMGNLTAADATRSCFLALVPHGASYTAVSSVNFPAQAAGTGIANAFTVGLSTDGKVDIYTGNCSTYTVNIIMDITGYII